MHFSKVGSLAALAGLSQAFLIPPSISAADNKVVDAIPFEAQIIASSEQFLVDCPGCPVVFNKDNVVSHAQSKLKINLAIQNNEDGTDSLLINGLPVLPVAPSAALGGLHAEQLIQDPEGKWVQASNPELGYFLSVKPYHDRNQKDLSVYNVHLRIKEVANEFVRKVPAIDIKLIKTSTGKLAIVNSYVSHAPQHKIVAVVSAPECNNVLCRWKVTFMDKVTSLRKGCGHKGAANRPPRPVGIFKTGPHGRPRPAGFEHSRPHPHPHPHHHRHGRHNTVARVIRGIVFHIIVPMIIGAAIGIAASIIGAIVGQFIVFVWRALFRRGQRGQCSRQRAEEADKDAEDEKTAFLEDQEAPPVYEDAVGDEKSEQK